MKLNIQIPQGPISDSNGNITLEWFVFIQALIAASGAGTDTNISDLQVELSFTSDNTSQVADLQFQIDHLSTGGEQSPFDVTGTVRYVNATAPSGVLGVSGVPYQNNGTMTFAWSGTSGGVPYFSSGTAMASSGVLTNHAVVLGGGAGAAPVTISVGANNTFLAGNTGANPGFRGLVAASADLANQGTTTTVLHGNAAGNPSWAAVSLTADVSGVLPLANGGTNANLTAVNGGVAYSTAAAIALTAAGTAGDWLKSAGAASPVWGSPAALTKTDDTNVTLTLGGSASTSLLNAASLTLGWTGQLAVTRGGTGVASATAYAVLCGGTTSTGAFQSVAALGSSGDVLTSNGAGALPTFQPAGAATVSSSVYAFAASHG